MSLSYQPTKLIGIVTKTGAQSKLQKTITVTVSRKLMHPILLKEMNRSKKYLVHDEAETASLNDRVEIQLGRPLSARKRFFLEKIISRGEGSVASSSTSKIQRAAQAQAQAKSSSSSSSTPISTNPSSPSDEPTISSLATAFSSPPIISEDALPDAGLLNEKQRARKEERKKEEARARALGVRI